MPLPSELEALCQRLETGEPEPSAASLIRQQAREIDELWDRLQPILCCCSPRDPQRRASNGDRAASCPTWAARKKRVTLES